MGFVTGSAVLTSPESFAIQAFGFYDALTTRPLYHPYLDIRRLAGEKIGVCVCVCVFAFLNYVYIDTSRNF